MAIDLIKTPCTVRCGKDRIDLLGSLSVTTWGVGRIGRKKMPWLAGPMALVSSDVLLIVLSIMRSPVGQRRPNPRYVEKGVAHVLAIAAAGKPDRFTGPLAVPAGNGGSCVFPKHGIVIGKGPERGH